MPYNLGADEFEAWLRSRPSQAIVGQARDPFGDPLARFLTEREQHAAAVGYDKARIGNVILALPDWACQYQRLLDRKPGQTPVTARDALSLLWQAVEQSRRRAAWRAIYEPQRTASL
jgi:hypothetical protein